MGKPYDDYVDVQMVPWYKHQIERYYEHKDPCKNFKPNVDPSEEIDRFRDSADFEEMVALQNAADEQVSTLRILDELNKTVNAYWDEWQQFLIYERDRLLEFKPKVAEERIKAAKDKVLHDQYKEMTPEEIKPLERYEPRDALKK
mgnify:FL=1